VTPGIDPTGLKKLYDHYNARKFVHPDPLEFLYSYRNIRDREIVGLLAASLAYGRVAQILKSVSSVLTILGPSPHLYLKKSDDSSLSHAFSGFTHRFAKGRHLAAMLSGVKTVVNAHGSLNQCFIDGMAGDHDTLIPAMTFFTGQIAASQNKMGHLLARPEKGSACKRLNLFLRWMVRKDKVDPGGWEGIPRSHLIIPLDTHMHKVGLGLGLTARKQADMRTALEITEGFRTLAPDDPVKYDFALTRLGIRQEMDMDVFIREVCST